MGIPEIAHHDVAPPAMVGRLIQRAEGLSEAGQLDIALAVLSDAVDQDPTPTARIALALALAPTQPGRALDELEQAWDHARRLHSPRYRVLCCGHLALLHQRQGDAYQAARYRQHALTAEQELAGDDPEQALSTQSLIDLAVLWLSTPADAGWAECLLNAAAAGRPDLHQQATIASHRGVIAARTARPEDAIVHWAQAQRQFREAGDLAGAAHTLVNLGHLLQHQQRPAMARRAFLIARDLFDEARLQDHAAAADRFAGEAATFARLADGNPAWN